MLHYWDTSALLALMFSEERTKDVRRLASKGKALPGYTSFLTLLEMESAYSRRLAEGSLSREDLPRLRLRARKLEAALGLIWPDPDLLEASRQHILEFGLRPGDALQLASSGILAQGGPEVVFVSLDHRLNEAARSTGSLLP